MHGLSGDTLLILSRCTRNGIGAWAILLGCLENGRGAWEILRRCSRNGVGALEILPGKAKPTSKASDHAGIYFVEFPRTKCAKTKQKDCLDTPSIFNLTPGLYDDTLLIHF